MSSNDKQMWKNVGMTNRVQMKGLGGESALLLVYPPWVKYSITRGSKVIDVSYGTAFHATCNF
jgi:hypothetical protein